MNELVEKQMRIILEKRCSDIFNELTTILKQDLTLICYDDFIGCLLNAAKSYEKNGSFVSQYATHYIDEIKKAKEILPNPDDFLYSLLIGDSEKCTGYMASVVREDAAIMFVKLAETVAHDQAKTEDVNTAQNMLKHFLKNKSQE